MKYKSNYRPEEAAMYLAEELMKCLASRGEFLAVRFGYAYNGETEGEYTAILDREGREICAHGADYAGLAEFYTLYKGEPSVLTTEEDVKRTERFFSGDVFQTWAVVPGLNTMAVGQLLQRWLEKCDEHGHIRAALETISPRSKELLEFLPEPVPANG